MNKKQWHNSKHLYSYILLMYIKYINTCASNNTCSKCVLYDSPVCNSHKGIIPELFINNKHFNNDFVVQCDHSSCYDDCILFNKKDETCLFRLIFDKIVKVIGENYAN